MIIKKELPHQGAFLQAPYVFPEIRFFFEICGYAAGKTSSLGDAIMYAVSYFMGKKDKEGKNPKIGVCGITLTFLQKTLSGALEQMLRNSKSSYKYDKKANIIYIGNVELHLTPIENEGDIFGFDWACIGKDVPVATLRGDIPIKDVVVGDYALTTKGYKRVVRTMFSGIKETIEVNGIRCTPDHRFIDVFNNEIEAQDLTKTVPLVKLNTTEGLGQVATQSFSTVYPVVKKSKEDRRFEEVYDIEVEDAHEFFAGGILVHNCCFVDELDELPTHTCIAVVKALNDRCRQAIVGETRSPFLAFTTTSQGLKGTYQTIMNFRKIGISYMIIRGRTRDNIYLQKEYVDAMYKMYNEKEIKCLLEGEFISIDSGLVFPDYNPTYNKLDIDLYNNLDAGETVYIGQDFNCIEGNEGIYTDTGIVPIRDIVLGTRVLTRKGYKKVLTKKNNGSRIVVRCGNVWTTLDHVFITPKGDEERWKISNYYYLKKQHRSKFHAVKMLKVQEQQLLSYIKDLYGDQIKEHGILSSRAKAETSGCTERYMKTLLGKYLVEWLFTIKTECLIIVLKALSFLREKNTSKTTKQGKEYGNTGKKVNSKQKGLCAEYAVKHLQEISKRLEYAEKSVFSLIDEREGMQTEQFLEQRVESVFGKRGGRTVQILLNPLRKLADAVALSLKENLNLFTALRALKNVKELANGRVLYGVEREVFDIEVEDAHEFFVDGVLVHNCGFNKAVACIVKNRCIYVIKTYSFGDAREAPEVFRYDYPEQRIIWVPDMTYKEHFGDFAKELKSYGIRIAYRRCNPNIVSRNFAINKLLYARRLFLCDFASALDNALLIHQKDPKTGLPMKGQGENAPDHLTDALAYVVAHLLGWKRELKDVYDVTMGRALKKHREIGNTEEDDEDALNAIDNLAEMTL